MTTATLSLFSLQEKSGSVKSLSLQRVRNKPLPYLQGKGKKPRVYLAAGFVKHVKHGFSWAGRIQEQQESPRAAFKHFKLSTDSPQSPQGGRSSWESAQPGKFWEAAAGMLEQGCAQDRCWALSPPGDSSVKPGQLCRMGVTAVPRGHPVCATTLRSPASSANTA